MVPDSVAAHFDPHVEWGDRNACHAVRLKAPAVSAKTGLRNTQILSVQTASAAQPTTSPIPVATSLSGSTSRV